MSGSCWKLLLGNVSLVSPSLKGSRRLHQFVPKHKPVRDEDVKVLREFILGSERLMVLTGAGVSTESGMYFILYIYRFYQPRFGCKLI